MNASSSSLLARPKGTIPKITLAGIVLFGAMGCSNDDQNDSSAAPRGFLAASLSYEEVLAEPEVAPTEVPFQELLLGPTDRSLVDYALWVLRQPCIDAAGFREPPRRWAPTEEDRAIAGRRYYAIPLEQASTLGYAAPPPGATGRAQAEYEVAFDAYASGLGEADLQRFGEVVDDCRHQAELELCGGGDNTEGDGYCHRSLELEGAREAASYEAARASPAVREAERRWKRCMASAGYSFGSVEEAWDAGSALEVEQSVAQAVADMSCKEDAGLPHVWSTTEAMIQDEMIERDPGFFDGLDDQRSAMIARATAVARGEPSS